LEQDTRCEAGKHHLDRYFSPLNQNCSYFNHNSDPNSTELHDEKVYGILPLSELDNVFSAYQKKQSEKVMLSLNHEIVPHPLF
jgi:hypothetical protein